MQVGRVYDAACELLIAEEPGIGDEDVIIPVVAECDDSFLNDARRMQVDPRRRRRRRCAGRPRADRAGAGAARGRRRLRHRHELPGLQGRHRYGVAGSPAPATPSASW